MNFQLCTLKSLLTCTALLIVSCGKNQTGSPPKTEPPKIEKSEANPPTDKSITENEIVTEKKPTAHLKIKDTQHAKKAKDPIPTIINNEHAIAASQSNNAFEQKPVVKNDAISVLNPLPVIEQKIAVTKNEVSNIEPLPNIKIEAS
ncbi:hypothetical protein, partial [Fluviispira multicolorata]|uniref:hypothetical protein n=1 Tax=Fluviispira multicolorata TaxID=2654512 RepID=UPI0013762D8B